MLMPLPLQGATILDTFDEGSGVFGDSSPEGSSIPNETERGWPGEITAWITEGGAFAVALNDSIWAPHEAGNLGATGLGDFGLSVRYEIGKLGSFLRREGEALILDIASLRGEWELTVSVHGVEGAPMILDSSVPVIYPYSDLWDLHDLPGNNPDFNILEFRLLQSNNTNTKFNIILEEIRIGAIPEPGSAFLVLLGGFAILVRRNRA